MNKFQIFTLKLIRKAYEIIFVNEIISKPECIQDAELVSVIIYEALMSDKPCMIGRFGAFELSVLENYIGILKGKNKLDFIRFKQAQWWWEKSLIKSLNTNAGFFPPTHEKIEQFCRLILNDISQVDVLGSWLSYEANFNSYLKNAIKVRLMYLDPFWTYNPWTAALKGKKILVVHPFIKTIENQYKKREFLFKDKNFIPEFESLNLIMAVQSLGNEKTPFNDWFQALDYMKAEIDKVDYDICLIGCGAYGFPLAAHVKRMGKKAFHMGGSLQLLFGIKGKRWDSSEAYFEPGNEILIDYKSLPNNHWIRPSEDEKPINHYKVEDSCYW